MKIQSNTAKPVFSGTNNSRLTNNREHWQTEPKLMERCLELENQVKQQTAELLKSKDEKDVLLREVNHRVNNNLQIISSLLRLQSFESGDSGYLKFQNRIQSIALVHQVLHESEDLSKLDFNSYVERLSSELIKTYNLDAGSIIIDVNINDIYLDLDTCVLCGFMLNEVITNSIKFAFPGYKGGNINISCFIIGNNAQLVISDNGVGLPIGFDLDACNSLGIPLVKTLVSQLNGSLVIKNDEGLTFAIEFPFKKS